MSDTIKEFLVSVGYDVDSQSERKFKESIRSATLQAELLSQALIATARNIAEAVQKVAQNFESLYWTSQRTGARVKNIQALSYAVSQLGGSYEGAVGAIESFGQRLRSNPGYASLVRSLGVSTEANGKLRDQVDVLQDLGKALSTKSYPIALQYANALGIDENTLRALMSGDLARNMAEFQRIQKEAGLDPDKAAKASQELNREIRATQATVSAFVSKMLSDFMPAIRDFLEEFRKWIVDRGPEIQKVIGDIGSAFGDLARYIRDHGREIKEVVGAIFQAFLDVIKAVHDLIEGLKPLATAFDDISKSLIGNDGLKTAFELFAVYLAGAWLTSILGTFSKVRLGWLGIAALIYGAIALAPKNEQELMDRKKVTDTWFGNTTIGRGFNAVQNFGRGLVGLPPISPTGAPQQGPSAPAQVPTTKADRLSNANQAYQMFRDAGYSHAQALAWVGNLAGESNFNPRARGDGGQAHGAAQWHPDRRAQILQGTGIDVSSASWKDQIRAIIWEAENSPDKNNRVADRVKAAGNVDQAVREIVYGYERPANKEGDSYTRIGYAKGLERNVAYNPFANTEEDRSSRARAPLDTGPVDWSKYAQPDGPEDRSTRALFDRNAVANTNNSKAVTLNQTTEINVIGGSDPMATADSVQHVQGRVNSRLLRNTQGAVR